MILPSTSGFAKPAAAEYRRMADRGALGACSRERRAKLGATDRDTNERCGATERVAQRALWKIGLNIMSARFLAGFDLGNSKAGSCLGMDFKGSMKGQEGFWTGLHVVSLGIGHVRSARVEFPSPDSHHLSADSQTNSSSRTMTRRGVEKDSALATASCKQYQGKLTSRSDFDYASHMNDKLQISFRVSIYMGIAPMPA